MSAKTKISIILIILTVIQSLSFAFPLSPAMAASQIDITGDAKALNTDGYLDFTNENSNVTVNSETGKFTGYVFSDDVGWIEFGTTDNAQGPVYVELSSGYLKGKAYVLNTQNYIDFEANNSNVRIEGTTFSGHVFSDDIGWIDFSDTGVNAASSFIEYPIASWGFNEGYGQNANDSSGYEHTGILGATTGESTDDPSWTEESRCTAGKCLSFDGGDYVGVSTTVTDVKTVSFWVRPTTTTQVFLDLDGGSHSISATSGTITATGFSTVYVNGQRSKTISANSWQHIVATTSTAFDTSSATLGKVSTSYLTGFLDEVRLFATQKSADQVKGLYTAKESSREVSTQFGPNESWLSDGLIGYWDMDESSGTATDSSGLNNDLTNYGTTTFTAGKFGNGSEHIPASTQYFSGGESNDTGDKLPTGYDYTDWTLTNFAYDSTNDTYAESDSGGDYVIFKDFSLNVPTGKTINGIQVNIEASHCILCGTYGDQVRAYLSYNGGTDWTSSKNAGLLTTSDVVYPLGGSTDTWGRSWNSTELNNTNFRVKLVAGVDIASFPAGSLLLNSNGEYKPIETFSEGDMVLSWDTENNTFTTNKITHPSEHISDKLYILNGEVKATDSELVYTKKVGTNSFEWINISNVEVGDIVLKEFQGEVQETKINTVEIENGQYIVYSIHTEKPFNNYWVEHYLFDEPGTGEVSVDTLEAKVYYSTGTTINDVNSVSFWVNPDNTTNYYASLTSSAYITSTSGVLSATGFTNPKIYVNGVASNTIAADEWQLVTVTSDTAIDADQFYVGRVGSNYFDGTMDEVRLYNRALSPSEVQKLYNWAPGPIGYWKMDEGTGTTAYDSSGNGNNSTTWTGDTKWDTGKFGSGLYFDGDNDVVRIAESTSTDLGATTDSYTVEAWFKTNHEYSSNGGILDKSTSTSSPYPFQLYIDSSTEVVVFKIRDSGGTAPSINSSLPGSNDNLWHHAAGVRDVANDMLYLYIDGILVDSDTDTTTLSLSNDDDISIGNGLTSYSANDFLGNIDDVRIYNYARTPQQIVEDMNAGHPAPGSPVGSAIGHWKFDEGYGDTAYDSGTGGNNGNLAGATSCPQSGDSACPTWTNDGKFGKALLFDTSGTTDDYVDLGTITEHQFSDNFTISAWVSATSFSSSRGIVTHLYSGTNYGWALATDDTSTVAFLTHALEGWGVTTVDSNPSTGEWFHLVGVRRNGTNYVYLNGVQQSTTSTQAPDTGAVNTVFGRWRGDLDGLYFNGLIDEVQIFNSALSSDQVKLLYNQGSAEVWGAKSTDSSGNASWSATNEYCPPGQTTACVGPVGEWKFDENTGTGTDAVKDTSGNDYHGTMDTSKSESDWVPGKRGSALNFTGNSTGEVYGADQLVSDYPFTISAWINSTTTLTSRQIINLTDSSDNTSNYGLYLNYGVVGKIGLSAMYEGSGNTLQSNQTPLNDGKWHQITGVYESSTSRILYIDGAYDNISTNSVSFDSGVDFWNIGISYGTTSPFNGLLDEVKVYDYARTPAQIAWEYNRGGPVGWWKLDECSGSTAYDSSGNENNGTITIGGSGTQDDTGTCTSGDTGDAWYNGATGKFNSSLNFDGTDDYIEIADTDDLSFGNQTTDKPFSITAWAKINLPNAFTFLSKGDSSSLEYIFYNDSASNDLLAFKLYDDNSVHYIEGKSVTSLAEFNNEWVHVAGTYDGSSSASGIKLYMNGDLTNSTPKTYQTYTAMHNHAVSAKIGRLMGYSTYSDGLIDEVKLFNYELTPQQVRNEYNNGIIRFGP